MKSKIQKVLYEQERIALFFECWINGDIKFAYKDAMSNAIRSKDGIDWEKFSKNSNIPFSFFEKHSNKINWNSISLNKNITIPFIEKNINKLNWKNLCSNLSVPFALFRKHLNYIHWPSLCKNKNIPLSFFKNNLDNVCFNSLCENDNIPFSFLKKNLDKIDWDKLCLSRNIPLSFIEDNLDKICWDVLSGNISIPESFFEKYLNHVCWKELCTNENISVDFFEKHLDKVVWGSLCKNKNVPVSFFEKYLDLENLDYVYFNEHIQPKELLECLYNLYFYQAAFKNIPIPPPQNYINRVSWTSICENDSVPFEYFEKNLDTFTIAMLSSVRFDTYFLNLEKQEYKNIMKNSLEQIESVINTIPENISSCLPKGGACYLDVIAKYKI